MNPSDVYWSRLHQLCWMIANLAAVRGYCPRGSLRVMYQDIFGDDVMRSSRKSGSNGRHASAKLGEDLVALERLGLIERRDVRVIVTDWEKLHILALQARAA